MAERYQFPPSFAQQRLWFLEQLEGASDAAGTVYNIRLPIRLTGPLNTDLLQQALDAVVRRHESLRTTFAAPDGEPVQEVHSATVVPISVVELTPSVGETADLRDEIANLASVRFDLATGPLLRARLLRLAPDDHVLVLVAHHIVSDAWSSGILFRDLALYYDALTRGAEPSLPDLPVQYADYASWQREELAGPALERQLDWWRQHLADAPPILKLPTDRPRPPLQTFAGSRISRRLPEALLTALKGAAASAGVTLYMYLLAAFGLCLARRSGQDDLVIGTPIAGRSRSELEPLIGLFANTLALRLRLFGLERFEELLAQVRSTSLGAFAHQDLPFEKLVEALKPPRDLAHSPVFQVLFALQNTPWEEVPWGGLVASPAEVAPAGTAKFDLSLAAIEYAGELWLHYEFNTDLFDAGTIDTWADGFESLLSALALPGERSLRRLPVMSGGERERLLHDWNDTAEPGGVEGDLWNLLAAQPAGPEAVALEFTGSSMRWTYRELFDRVEALAARLQLAGAAAGSTVAIAAERGPLLLVAILAAIRSGIRYLPLDPRHPPERLRALLADAEAELLLADAATLNRLPEFAGVRLVLEAPLAVVAAGSTEIPLPGTVPATADAYLIYTSGSTGQPKGVRVTRGAVRNFLASMAEEPGLTRADRLLAITTVSFDIAVLELLLPLTVGATVVMADADTAADLVRLRDALAERRITVLQATPATWRGLVATGWEGSARLRAFCGGEALMSDLATALAARTAELWNLYGPTETTIWSTVARIDPVNAAINVGHPIANTRCYVLDDAGELLPTGAPGELWIGGVGVAAGYHRRPELTADRFRSDPYARTPGERMYGTGDRARWNADGTLQVLGRTDFQVKLRGFRIEPGEVEAALESCAGVADAAVGVVDGPAGSSAEDRRLVAWVVATPGATLDGNGLRENLRRQLPDYLVPSAVTVIPSMPQTPNGKRDRRALPVPAWQAADRAAIGPRSPVEECLASLFAEVLGIGACDIHGDFFDLGGHSLLATRLVARIRTALGVDLTLRQLFEAPTVARLAERLGAVARLPASPASIAPAPAAPRQELSTGAPLSPVQQRLWFLDQLEPGNPVYHLGWAVGLRGVLDLDALEQAVADVVARHDVLRTRFSTRDGEAEQVIDPPGRLKLSVEDIPAAGRPDFLRALVQRPFELPRGPLVRFCLVRNPANAADNVLAIVVHHIIADGWSLSVLFRDLSAAYRARRQVDGARVEWSPLPLQYADWSRWQQQMLAEGAGQRQLDYWTRALAGAPLTMDLYGANPRPARMGHQGARQFHRIPQSVQQGLRQLARRSGCTLYTVALAAFSLVVGRYAGREDLLIGTPVAGRTRAELEDLIGFFVNTLVLRVQLRGNPTVAELLRRVHALTLDAWSHQDAPFEQLVERLNPPRDPGRTPLFQVLFNFHNEPAAHLDLPGLEVTPLAIQRHTAKFDLSASLTEGGDGMGLVLEYSTALFSAEWAAEFAECYGRVLAAFAEPSGERAALADAGIPEGKTGRSAVLPGAGGSVIAAFRTQVERRPSAIAVSAGDVDCTYADLAARAGAIAALLSARGLGPGDRVGLWLKPGVDQVAALLGVMAGGASAVPLDTALPETRLATLCESAGLKALLWDGTDAPPLALDALDGIRLDTLSFSVLPERLPEPGAEAYLLHTSGSTGTPKPVPQSHGNLLLHVQAWGGALALHDADCLGLVSRYGYDSGLQDIFGALIHGARLRVLDVLGLSQSELLAALATDVTVLHLTPSLFRECFADLPVDGDFASLRWLILGGEAARASDAALAARHLPRARVVNGYGLTEATAVLQWQAPRSPLPAADPLPVGQPLGNVRVSLVDDDGEPAAVTGELVVKSNAVTPASGPVFATGDRMRRLPDGNLAWIGRKDLQVKIAGQRVEPAEVEAALDACAGVRRSVVLKREVGDAALLPVLVAFVQGEADAQSLGASLRARLPAAAVPTQFIFKDTLPLLANGKVDRQALLAEPLPPCSRGAEPAGDGDDPVTRELIGIWSELLPAAAPEAGTDFFAVGGHSLLAMRFLARVRERLGVDLPLLQFFEQPTLGGIAGRVRALAGEGRGHEPAGAALSAIRVRNRRAADRSAAS